VAIIMDGNGRWANSLGRRRTDGHREGARTVRAIVTRARELGIGVLTLYAFSAQNWSRPPDEVDSLMSLLVEFCESEQKLLSDKAIRFRVIGDRSRLPAHVRAAVELLEELTRSNTSMQLVVAVSYGGREELASAARRVAEEAAAGRLTPGDVNVETFGRFLWTGDLPDPDLVIRTSGEVRISNFLLWQSAYAEYVIEPKCWPELTAEDFDRCLVQYARRERRYGGLSATA
jgi:undecaprenyl diphosphate synthase